MAARHPLLLIIATTACIGLVPISVGASPAPHQAAGTSAEETCANAGEVGCWLAPFSEDGTFNDRPPRTADEAATYPTAVSASVLPDGRILYWNGFEAFEHADDIVLLGGMPPPDENRSVTRVLDLSGYLLGGADPRQTARWTVPTPENGGQADLFCADQRHLPDGSVIAVGGTKLFDINGGTYGQGTHMLEYAGVEDVRVFDPTNDTWTPRADMHHPRWYPSMITLPDDDGDLLVVGGADQLIYDDDGGHVNETETYERALDTWTENGRDGEQSLPLYPRLHVLPNGQVHFGAHGQMWNPFGQSADQLTWSVDKLFDPEANEWTNVAPALARNSGFSAYLPLRPNPLTGEYDEAEILVGGGTIGVTPGTWVATPLTERVSWSADAPSTVSRSVTGAMNAGRWFGSAVVLPTGETIALNGADADHLWFPGTEHAVRLAESYDPDTGTWTPLSSGARDRTYHNSAVLLPDGSILVGGHAPHAHMWGTHHGPDDPPDDPGHVHGVEGANPLRDPSFEIFQPPYLFRGERPVISAALDRVDRTGSYPIDTPDAEEPTLQAILSRLPSVTHVTDADQRVVELAITGRDHGGVTVSIPRSKAVLPDGHYYLFLVKDNGEGPTPSHAQIVRVGNDEGGGEAHPPAPVPDPMAHHTADPDLAISGTNEPPLPAVAAATMTGDHHARATTSADGSSVPAAPGPGRQPAPSHHEEHMTLAAAPPHASPGGANDHDHNSVHHAATSGTSDLRLASLLAFLLAAPLAFRRRA